MCNFISLTMFYRSQPHFERLPNELLREILLRAARRDVNDAVTLTRVNKRAHDW